MTVRFAYETTPLHGFITNYFSQLEAKVIELQEYYFEVQMQGGARRKFTYSSTAAAENETIQLLAPGSKALKEIFDKAATNGSAAVLVFKQSQGQVGEFIANKWQTSSVCCSKCPQYGDCKYGKCCRICPNRHDCHHAVIGDRLQRVVVNDQGIKLFFQFTFLVEVINPIRKQDELFQVLVDSETGQTYEALMLDVIETNLYQIKERLPLNLQMYDKALTHSYAWVESKLQGNLAFLNQQTMRAVSEKIIALKHRLEMESAQGKSVDDALLKYQKSRHDLDKQYRINVEITLLSALGLQVPEYQLQVELEGGCVVPVVLNPVINRVAHALCHECGKEMLEGWVCVNGHYVCGECAGRCLSCGSIFCASCSESMARCGVCGDLLCDSCRVPCFSCGQDVCKDHLYSCCHCGEPLCLSCINICPSCGKDHCLTHAKKCSCCDTLSCDHCSIVCNASKCERTLLRDHAKECSYCHEFFCGEHIAKTFNGQLACIKHRANCVKCNREYRIDELNTCAVCEGYLCHDDQETCYQCQRILCPRDTLICGTCQGKGCAEHTRQCIACGNNFCLSHIHQCNRCSQWVCGDHVFKCRGCGGVFCSCVNLSTCKICRQEYCNSCLEDNMCSACRNMTEVDSSNCVVQQVKNYDSKVAGWKKWGVGYNTDSRVVVGYSRLGGKMFIVSKDGMVLQGRNLSIVEKMKRPMK